MDAVVFWLAALDDARGVPWYGKLIAAGGLVLLIWLGFVAWQGKDDFRIVVRGGKVKVRGRFPVGCRADAADFLLNQVNPPGTLRVIGNWTPGHVLRISVQGRLPPGEQQRIRNFMKLMLKG